MKTESKKVILCLGCSGHMGKELFAKYNNNNLLLINVSRSKKLEIQGVINIIADITKSIDILKIKYKIQTITERVDVIVLGAMFSHHKRLYELNKAELFYEFNVNVFAQIEILKLIDSIYWRGKSFDKSSVFFISSEICETRVDNLFRLSRSDLESYLITKMCLEYMYNMLRGDFINRGIECNLIRLGDLKSISGINQLKSLLRLISS